MSANRTTSKAEWEWLERVHDIVVRNAIDLMYMPNFDHYPEDLAMRDRLQRMMHGDSTYEIEDVRKLFE